MSFSQQHHTTLTGGDDIHTYSMFMYLKHCIYAQKLYKRDRAVWAVDVAWGKEDAESGALQSVVDKFHPQTRSMIEIGRH